MAAGLVVFWLPAAGMLRLGGKFCILVLVSSLSLSPFFSYGTAEPSNSALPPPSLPILRAPFKLQEYAAAGSEGRDGGGLSGERRHRRQLRRAQAWLMQQHEQLQERHVRWKQGRRPPPLRRMRSRSGSLQGGGGSWDGPERPPSPFADSSSSSSVDSSTDGDLDFSSGGPAPRLGLLRPGGGIPRSNSAGAINLGGAGDDGAGRRSLWRRSVRSLSSTSSVSSARGRRRAGSAAAAAAQGAEASKAAAARAPTGSVSSFRPVRFWGMSCGGGGAVPVAC